MALYTLPLRGNWMSLWSHKPRRFAEAVQDLKITFVNLPANPENRLLICRSIYSKHPTLVLKIPKNDHIFRCSRHSKPVIIKARPDKTSFWFQQTWGPGVHANMTKQISIFQSIVVEPHRTFKRKIYIRLLLFITFTIHQHRGTAWPQEPVNTAIHGLETWNIIEPHKVSIGHAW